MTTPVTVPTRPILVNVPRVELVHAGTWDLSTGPVTFTSADLYAAVAAMDCPAVRRPSIKLGHVDARFDGEPAVGWIGNLAVSASGSELVGDYVGIPSWLADVMASAYPDRSIEGQYDFKCSLGHSHPFVLTGLALLGITAPGVGTLASLQDIAGLYGIAAASPTADDAFRVQITPEGGPMPASINVAASASVEDVRRSFYDDGPGKDNWMMWIEDIFIDPAEVVACNDEDGSLVQVSFTVDATTSAVTWGDAVEVKRTYVAAAAKTRPALAAWASRTESRPDAPRTPAAATADDGNPPNVEGSAAVEFTTEQIAALLAALGLASDSTDAQAVVDAVVALAADEANEPPDPPKAGDPPVAASAAKLPEGMQIVETATIEALRVDAAAGRAAREEQLTDQRRALVAAAVNDGRIAPVRREHWVTQLAADPGAAEVLASLAKGLIPVDGERGHAGEEVAATGASIRESDVYKNWSK